MFMEIIKEFLIVDRRKLPDEASVHVCKPFALTTTKAIGNGRVRKV